MVSSYTFVTRTCLDRDREELQIEADRITEFHHIHVCVIATLRYVDTREKYWFLFLLTLPKKSGDIWLTTVNQFSVLRKSSIWFGGKSDSGARFAWASVCLPFQFKFRTSPIWQRRISLELEKCTFKLFSRLDFFAVQVRSARPSVQTELRTFSWTRRS